MHVARGLEALPRSDEPVFVVVGVFDGLHLGHAYLLRHLVAEADRRRARPVVITFDHHPDEVLTGSAPPLLLDPEERLERLADAGVELTVVHHFDEATRRTPFDAFIRGIAGSVDLAGFLMTPDSSFGYERGGTPSTVAALGRELGYDVVVVPTLDLDGRAVRSSEIRAAIAAGDLAAAARLLGRPYAVVGRLDGAGEVRPPMPVALPPEGRYRASIDGRGLAAAVRADRSLVLLDDVAATESARVVFG